MTACHHAASCHIYHRIISCNSVPSLFVMHDTLCVFTRNRIPFHDITLLLCCIVYPDRDDVQLPWDVPPAPAELRVESHNVLRNGASTGIPLRAQKLQSHVWSLARARECIRLSVCLPVGVSVSLCVRSMLRSPMVVFAWCALSQH